MQVAPELLGCRTTGHGIRPQANSAKSWPGSRQHLGCAAIQLSGCPDPQPLLEAQLIANQLLAIKAGHHAGEHQFAALKTAVNTDGHLTATFQGAQEGAFGQTTQAVGRCSSTLICSRTAASASRHSMPKAPWPGVARSKDRSTHGCDHPGQSHQTSSCQIKQSNWPESSFSRRVITLPRTSLKLRCG